MSIFTSALIVTLLFTSTLNSTLTVTFAALTCKVWDHLPQTHHQRRQPQYHWSSGLRFHQVWGCLCACSWSAHLQSMGWVVDSMTQLGCGKQGLTGHLKHVGCPHDRGICPEAAFENVSLQNASKYCRLLLTEPSEPMCVAFDRQWCMWMHTLCQFGPQSCAGMHFNSPLNMQTREANRQEEVENTMHPQHSCRSQQEVFCAAAWGGSRYDRWKE